MTAEEIKLHPESVVSFSDLGWTQDIVLSSSSPTVSVEFELPAGANQGVGAWYAAQLAYEWSGVPPTDNPAYLYGLWNGEAMYQLKVKRESALPVGAYMWSMVDGIWGGSAGIEYSSAFSGRSTNFATRPAVKPGLNRLDVQLDLTFAAGADVEVVVRRDSKIVVTTWGPPDVRLQGEALLRPGELAVDLAAHNKGLPTVELSAQALILYHNGERQSSPIQLTTEPSARQRWRLKDTIGLARDDVSSAYVILSAPTGSRPFRIWPPDEGTWRDVRLPGWSTPVALLAVVVLWISVPAALNGLRGRSP